MRREDLSRIILNQAINGKSEGLTPLEMKEYRRIRKEILRDRAEGKSYVYDIPSDLPMHGMEFSYMDVELGFTKTEFLELSATAESIAKWVEDQNLECEDGYFIIERNNIDQILRIGQTRISFPSAGSAVRDISFARLTMGILAMVINNYNNDKRYHRTQLEALICMVITIREGRELGFHPDFSTPTEFNGKAVVGQKELLSVAEEIESGMSANDIYHLVRYCDYLDPDTGLLDDKSMLKNTHNSELITQLLKWWNGYNPFRQL